MDTSSWKSVHSNYWVFLHIIHRIKLKHFKVHSVESETSDLIVNAVVNSLREYNVEDTISFWMQTICGKCHSENSVITQEVSGVEIYLNLLSCTDNL